MAFYSVHHAYVSNSTNSIESVQDLISNISRQLDELAQKRGDVSNGVKWSSFGEPTPPAHVEYSVQVPTQDDFDDIEKLILLTLEFTWSAQDDPIRKVILEEMKKIKSGKELVEEVRKIEKNINAGGTISSLLELSVAGISVDTCEVPIPSHSLEKDSIRQEEERPQSEDVLEAKAQNDPKLEFPSDQVEEPSSLTLEEVKEAIVLEDEELEIHLPIVIQEFDVTGLSNPLDDMRPYDFFASTLHYKIPSLKVDLKKYLLGDDDTYPVVTLLISMMITLTFLMLDLCLMINIIPMLILRLLIPTMLSMCFIAMVI
ncbi:hypothetical protein ZWY2020_003894 [Hordeum vulgare]|nr:hypothetical protein ZWY2020_003894 [Hordeum vulgare]